MLSIGRYVRVQDLREAYELLQSNRRARVLGGGCWLRLGSGSIPLAIDLADCGLDRIDEVADDPVFGRAFSVGAYVTLRALETNERLAAATDALLQRAVRDIVGVQFRNVATVGGSVAGRFGFSDVCCALLALGAHVELAGAGRMPLEALMAQRGRLRDVLARVIVPAGPVRAAYQAVRKQSTDIPVANVCAVCDASGDWRVAVGARPGPARLVVGSAGERFPAATTASRPCIEEPRLSPDPTPDEVDAAVRAARALPFSGNMWAGARYRRDVAGVLVGRAIEEASRHAAPTRSPAPPESTASPAVRAAAQEGAVR